MADVPFVNLTGSKDEKPFLGQNLLDALLRPKLFVGFIAVLAAVIMAGEFCIMFLLSKFPIESPILEAIIDASMLMSIITPALLLIYQRPLTRRVETPEAPEELAREQSTQQPKTLPQFLLNSRRVLCMAVLLGILIFSGEMLVMFFLLAFPLEHPVIEAVVDSALLVALISPALVYLFYRPVLTRVQALSLSKQHIRALTQRLMQSSEDEQRRLALDLHDEFGQTLSAMKLEVDSLRNCFEPSAPELSKTFSSLHKRIDEMRDSVHNIARRLRPSILDDLGISPALEGLVNEYQGLYVKVDFDLMITGLKVRPCSEVETAIYRICQEAINNALKHANPKHIEVRLTASYPELIVQVKDDGCGFEADKDFSSESEGRNLGILGMRERAESYGGRLSVSSRSESGTTVRAVFPEVETAHEINT